MPVHVMKIILIEHPDINQRAAHNCNLSIKTAAKTEKEGKNESREQIEKKKVIFKC